MPRDQNERTGEKQHLTGRRGYMKMAAAGLFGASMVSSQVVSRVKAATVVNLGDKGLSNGDVIDSYLEEYLESGTEVHIPAGEYEWRGSGIGGTYSDAALVGQGDVTFDFTRKYWNASVLAVNGGDFAIKNVTIKGQIDADGNKSRFRFDARHSNSTVTLENFNLPDGDVGNSRAIGIYVGPEHAGTIHVNHCHIEGFPNNGLYAGPYGRSGAGGGRVIVENSFFKNNNIDAVRLGGHNDTIRNCVIVQEEVPALEGGAKSGRGIRIRYPGDDITVENVHITTHTSSPFIVPDRAGWPSGSVDGLYIENHTGGTAAYVESGSFTGNDIHVTGGGNRNITGFDSASNVYNGSNAESPAKSLDELGVDDPLEDSNDTDDGSDDSSNDDSDESDNGSDDSDESEQLPHTITIDGTSRTGKDYHFEVSGDVEGEARLNPADTINGSSVDGRVFTSSDAYRFSGEVEVFESDSIDNLVVYIDGNRVDPEEFGSLPNEIVIEGTGQYAKDYSFTVSGELEPGPNLNPDDNYSETSADGLVWWSADRYRFSGELEELDVETTDDMTVYVNGEEVDPAAIGSQPVPNRLVIDGTQTDGTASYTFEVTEAIEGSADLGSLESGDEISGTTVSGTIENDLDGYRFAGNIVSMNVDGAATVTIEQTQDE